MRVKSLDQLKAEHLEERKLVEDAKTYLARLPRGVFREVVFDAMSKLEAEIAGQRQASAAPVTDTPPHRKARSAFRRYKKNGPASVRRARKEDEKITHREAITRVLANDAALPTGSIVEAVHAFLPNAGYASLASEVARMRAAGLVTERGENESGRALYALVSGAKEAAR